MAHKPGALESGCGSGTLLSLVVALWSAAVQTDGVLPAAGVERATFDSVITETCLDQDKPPCAMVTSHLPEPDGSNVIRIVVAYPFSERRTNLQNVPYYSGVHLGVAPGNGLDISNSYLAAPSGMSFVLPEGSAARGPARLISVERLKPTVPVSRLRPRGPPHIVITDPRQTVTSQPMIQLKGLSDQPLASVRFDLINAAQRLLNQQGWITGSYFDIARWQDTTDYFQCFDIDLAPGTNTVILRCEDLANRVTTNVLSYELRLDQDKTPPVVSIEWPRPGRQISDLFFSARGQIDDATASVTARLSAGRQALSVPGVVERNGRFWVEHLPLLARTNLLELTVTDAAGNNTYTNIPVIRSHSTLVIDPVPPEQLWQLQVTVTGSVEPANQRVWLNGKEANVQRNGKWSVKGIPLDASGVAIFEAMAIPEAGMQPPSLAEARSGSSSIAPEESVAVQAVLHSSSVILNATQPTYGTFKLHLTGTAGLSYVLSVSTNLVDWSPILTNSGPAPMFDYLDTNVTSYGCRFFRVTPIQ